MQLKRKLKSKVHSVVARVEKPLYPIVSRLSRSPLFPDFMVIGAMKAATTWLYENLRCHPDVFLPEQKEDYFFSHHFYERSLYSYLRRFKHGGGRVKGEITPGYGILSRDRIKLIHGFNPDLRLVFIARNPVDRSWSEAVMNLVDKPRRSFTDVGIDEFLAYVRSANCQARSDYLAILANWLSVFSRAQMFVGLHDSVRTNPRRFLEDIFRHLDLSCSIDWDELPFAKVIVPSYEAYGGVHGGSVAAEQRRIPEMPGEVRAFLQQRYAADIAEFGRLYGLPIANWLP